MCLSANRTLRLRRSIPRKASGDLRVNEFVRARIDKSGSISNLAVLYLDDPNSVDLKSFNYLDDAAANTYSHKNNLDLSSLEISNATAKSLSKHVGALSLNGLEELSQTSLKSLSSQRALAQRTKQARDAAAQSLEKHQGTLALGD